MLRYGHILQLLVMALLGLGLVMVHSAGSRIGMGQDVMTYIHWRQLLYAGMALVAMAFASRLDIRSICMTRRGLLNPLLWMIIIMFGMIGATFIPGLARTVNGSSRWLFLGVGNVGVSFQPSEMAKLLMVLTIAWWTTRKAGVMHKFWYGLLPILVLLGGTCAAIVLEDLGTGVLIGIVGVILLISAGARIWQLALLAPGIIFGLVAAIMHSPYRVARLMAFMDPWADPQGTGYHPIQSMLAIAMGGITGRGLGGGIQKFGYLPEDTTDFIFATICEEMGITGALVVVGLFLCLVWTAWTIASQCRDPFGRILGLGVLLTVGLQAAMNLAVVTVLVPTKGIALPLVSSGGTGWILTAFALGLVVSLDNAHHLQNQLHLDDDVDTTIPQAQPTAVAA
ncbi:MAG: FtsW/RodA/SpoVE family cell cycle protein [Phycisphaeraceae bacterium JB051]